MRCLRMKTISLCNFERIFIFSSGDYGMKVTPLPIPNRSVKLQCANGTAGATLWESRSSPGNVAGQLSRQSSRLKIYVSLVRFLVQPPKNVLDNSKTFFYALFNLRTRVEVMKYISASKTISNIGNITNYFSCYIRAVHCIKVNSINTKGK